jgi:hypothetical protein
VGESIAASRAAEEEGIGRGEPFVKESSAITAWRPSYAKLALGACEPSLASIAAARPSTEGNSPGSRIRMSNWICPSGLR